MNLHGLANGIRLKQGLSIGGSSDESSPGIPSCMADNTEKGLENLAIWHPVTEFPGLYPKCQVYSHSRRYNFLAFRCSRQDTPPKMAAT